MNIKKRNNADKQHFLHFLFLYFMQKEPTRIIIKINCI